MSPPRRDREGYARRLTRRWLWFFGLWIVGFGGVAALAYGVKWLMGL